MKKSHPDKIPSQYQLAKLAAIVSQTQGVRNRVGCGKAVGIALDLWREAGEQIANFGGLETRARERKSVIGGYGESLLVGKHFLPEIQEEHLSCDRCEFDEFLEFAVGLSEKSDRLRWFRAFVCAWREDVTPPEEGVLGPLTYRELTYKSALHDAYSPELQEFRVEETLRKFKALVNGGTPPEVLAIDPSSALEKFREKGVVEPALTAGAFRRWRLTMKNPTTKAARTCSVEEAILKAKQMGA